MSSSGNVDKTGSDKLSSFRLGHSIGLTAAFLSLMSREPGQPFHSKSCTKRVSAFPHCWSGRPLAAMIHFLVLSASDEIFLQQLSYPAHLALQHHGTASTSEKGTTHRAFLGRDRTDILLDCSRS